MQSSGAVDCVCVDVVSSSSCFEVYSSQLWHCRRSWVPTLVEHWIPPLPPYLAKQSPHPALNLGLQGTKPAPDRNAKEPGSMVWQSEHILICSSDCTPAHPETPKSDEDIWTYLSLFANRHINRWRRSFNIEIAWFRCYCRHLLLKSSEPCDHNLKTITYIWANFPTVDKTCQQQQAYCKHVRTCSSLLSVLGKHFCVQIAEDVLLSCSVFSSNEWMVFY